MRVFKFGGASVNSTVAVRNMAAIVKDYGQGPLTIVVSAMGKTTNRLEQLVPGVRPRAEHPVMLEQLYDYHIQIVRELFPNPQDAVYEAFERLFAQLKEQTEKPATDYNYDYDQTVCFGELISTTIVSHYLASMGLENEWVDVRQVVRTDNHYREGIVDFEQTQKLARERFAGKRLFVTQGFIAGTDEGTTTTLGREGSDYSAAIFANCLNASEVTIWKDVDGLLNADPKRFPQTVKIPHISYPEAIELAFYGATVIHPKTMKPLQNKNIALHVRSFIHPENEPTVIDGRPDSGPSVPSYIVKDRQTLVSFSPRDYSFMNEHNLKTIFAACDSLRIHANMIQTSALMLSLCIDSDENRLSALIDCLREQFSIKYNEGLQLFTVRHRAGEQPSEIETEFMKGKKVIVKQGSRSTLQFVLKTV